MPVKSVIIPKDLHARPVTLLIQKTQEFKDTQVFLKKNEKKLQANSLIGILSLGIKKDDIIEIETTGEKEKEALTSLADFLERGICEER